MSGLPLSDVAGSECAYTDYLRRIICVGCGDEFEPSRTNQRYCTRDCQHNSTRDEASQLKKKLNNIAHLRLNRDRYISLIDGRYEGPMNKCVTLVLTIKKDRGYHPMPIDVHVKPVEPRFSQVTIEDVDWAQRQLAFPHTQPMPRLFRSFCVHCVEMVIDEAAAQVRATRGVYLPVEHDCARVRVYDLRGNLLEVKQL